MLAILTQAYQGIGKQTLDTLVSSDLDFPKISAPRLHLKGFKSSSVLGCYPTQNLARIQSQKSYCHIPEKHVYMFWTIEPSCLFS
jgi:hypothetical protein